MAVLSESCDSGDDGTPPTTTTTTATTTATAATATATAPKTREVNGELLVTVAARFLVVCTGLHSTPLIPAVEVEGGGAVVRIYACTCTMHVQICNMHTVCMYVCAQHAPDPNP